MIPCRKKRQTANSTISTNATTSGYYCIKKTLLGSTVRSCLPQVNSLRILLQYSENTP